MPDKNSLYKKLVNVTSDYLGPAAERFIDRQIHNHLHKNPDDLTKSDLIKLEDWIRGAVSLLTDNREVVERYMHQLNSL